MKTAYWLLAMLLTLTACKHKTQIVNTQSQTDSLLYPYAISHPDYWTINPGHSNTLLALRVIKAFEQTDTITAKMLFGDSVQVFYDGGSFKGRTRELLKTIADDNKYLRKLTMVVKNWQSVISKDGREQWVTTWYTQHWENVLGKKDSLDFIDDMQIANRKVVKIYEYTRGYHKK